MIKHISDCTVLNNGVKMPWFGLGVWKMDDGDEVIYAIKTAVSLGYRSIDTAAAYGNETGVGTAIKECDVQRKELFITTKLWNADQGYDTTLRAFDESMKRLGLDYLDLYLIHWPVKGRYKDSWRAMEKLYKEGVIKAIGVSNFQIHHLNDLLVESRVVPAVNQVEYHPLLSQLELHRYCKQHNIQLEAWSPLTRGKLFTNPLILDLSKKYQRTPAQILLRWDLEHEVVTIPKSIHKDRLIENMEIFDFSISYEDIELMDSLNINRRLGPDPDNFNF